MKRFLTTCIVFFVLVGSAFANSHVTLELWTARWCRSCPAAKKTAKNLEEKGYKVTYKNFDDNRKEADEKGISVLPTVIVSVDGKVYLKLVGLEFTVERIEDIPVPENPEPVPEPAPEPEPEKPDYYLTKVRGNDKNP